TTYRPNDVTGSVLSVAEEKAEWSDWIKSTLASVGTTQAALSAKVNQSVEHEFNEDKLSKIIHGKRKVSADELVAISSALGVPVPKSPNAAPVVATDDAEPMQPHGDVIYMAEPLDRPSALEGNTYKVKWPDSEHALYITINDLVIGGHRRPFEVFINSKNMEHFAWTVALTRMISAVFRRGGDVSFVVEELKAVFDPRGGAWMKGKYVPSILAAIGGVIEQHMVAIGFIEGEGMGLKTDPQREVVGLDAPRGKACSSCGSYEMRMIEGCMTCASCGYSKCG
ncbi:MAG: ribonucleoside-diphosphate reductase, adenosylcobalamin-dependent, partial [Pseudomonadota bacterium]